MLIEKLDPQHSKGEKIHAQPLCDVPQFIPKQSHAVRCAQGGATSHRWENENKAGKEQVLGRDGQGGILHCRWECQMLQLFCKRLWQFLQKLNIGLPYDPTAPLLSSRELNSAQASRFAQMFLATLFMTGKKMQTTQMSFSL